jgi:hypothetical protein
LALLVALGGLWLGTAPVSAASWVRWDVDTGKVWVCEDVDQARAQQCALNRSLGAPKSREAGGCTQQYTAVAISRDNSHVGLGCAEGFEGIDSAKEHAMRQCEFTATGRRYECRLVYP